MKITTLLMTRLWFCCAEIISDYELNHTHQPAMLRDWEVVYM